MLQHLVVVVVMFKPWLLITAPECAKPASLVMTLREQYFRLLLVVRVIRE